MDLQVFLQVNVIGAGNSHCNELVMGIVRIMLTARARVRARVRALGRRDLTRQVRISPGGEREREVQGLEFGEVGYSPPSVDRIWL